MTANQPEHPTGPIRTQDLNREDLTRPDKARQQPLSIDIAIPYFQSGAALLDTRSKAAYIQKHVPGSVYLEAGAQLTHRFRSVLPLEQPVILLLDDASLYETIANSLLDLGYKKVVGYLSVGIDGWEAYGLPVSSGDIQDVTARELDELIREENDRLVVIDVREPWEYTMGHIPDAILIPLGQLAARIHELDATLPAAVVCAHGSRSLSAAALLGQQGFQKIYNLVDGMHGWQNAGLSMSQGGNR